MQMRRMQGYQGESIKLLTSSVAHHVVLNFLTIVLTIQQGRCVRTPTAGPSNPDTARPACNRCLRMGTTCIVSQSSRARRAPVSITSNIARESRSVCEIGASFDPATNYFRLDLHSSVGRLEDGTQRDNAHHLQPPPDSRPRPASTRLTETPPSRSQSQTHVDSDYRPYEQPHLHQLDIDAHLDPGAHLTESDNNNSNLETSAHDGFLLSENQRAMRYDPEVLGILEEVEIRWLFDQ
jgi:hypothetical protein